MTTEIKSHSVVDLTCDVGVWKEPLHLVNSDLSEMKILQANDKFFDTWEECLFMMVVNTKNCYIVHCLVHASSTNSERLQAQYGWVLGYFQDCLYKGDGQ